ncbi:tryptophan synthase beta subunit-like PLP-dependent enzyme [Infundibulicybe gibba]|nr:tryptophan synthase beta subunit-like PLP-dependent enzyme [Infundibulicybe gibba]
MSPNLNNVFSGKDALAQYYNPDHNPLVELPDHPFVDDNVHIYAKMMTYLPAANVKLLPALNMLLHARESGRINSNTTIIEYSSGSTVTSLGILSRVMGLKGATAYVSNKTKKAKLDLLRFFLKLFGGPGQPAPTDTNGGIYQAVVDGEKGDNFNPSQYINEMNYNAHQRWTGPQIYKQLPNISVFATGMGTTGTITGTGLYLKSVKPNIVNVGVCTAPGDLVHGPRNFSLLKSIKFPWREAIDCLEDVSAFESYRASLDLNRNGLLCGPSSGLARTGLYNFLKQRKQDGTLDSLRSEDGSINCVFMCCDLPYQYIDEYVEILGEEAFPPIRDLNLLDVDRYTYHPEAELTAYETYKKLSSSKNALVIDINHLPNSISLDISHVNQPNPFYDSNTMVDQWTKLNTRLSQNDAEFGQGLQNKTVVVVCYTGNTSKIGASVLRNRGIDAFCCTESIASCLDIMQTAAAATPRL